jgi:DNA-binding NarL/FixJ family response regulator
MNRRLSLVVDLDPLLSPTGPVAFPATESDLLRKTCEDAVEKKRPRILLADDDLELLAATGKFLQPEFDVVDTVSDGLSLVDAALKFRPDVIVTDISMPKMNGLEAVRKIRSSLAGIKFVFLTMHCAESYRREAQLLGAAGYVLKCSLCEQLKQALHTAMEGTV